MPALGDGRVGTALGVITELHRRKKVTMVYADETRPSCRERVLRPLSS